MSFHSRFAPISASEYVICTEPRSRFTSAGRIGPLDAVETALRRGRNEVVKIGHGGFPLLLTVVSAACFLRAANVMDLHCTAKKTNRSFQNWGLIGVTLYCL